ncbi:hypothetical protein UFOVP1295_34 [uncultured Caudovirales phage]|uniref:Uncharacterized protein n=1 Tax=uncultured Caudovirales phage TaxID=2100421 RepID=A0A6J5RPZ2_9CAUD|nr:hypothetical protein UFOVP1295_34 [uncultured Caudovirales phage]
MPFFCPSPGDSDGKRDGYEKRDGCGFGDSDEKRGGCGISERIFLPSPMGKMVTWKNRLVNPFLALPFFSNVPLFYIKVTLQTFVM